MCPQHSGRSFPGQISNIHILRCHRWHTCYFAGMYSRKQRSRCDLPPSVGTLIFMFRQLSPSGSWWDARRYYWLGFCHFRRFLLKHFHDKATHFASLGAFAVGAVCSEICSAFIIVLAGRAVQEHWPGLALPMTFSSSSKEFPLLISLARLWSMTTLVPV